MLSEINRQQAGEIIALPEKERIKQNKIYLTI
jgi:hypothetical protein